MIAQLARFGAVGIAATLTHVTVAILAEALMGLSGQMANTMGFLWAVGVSYFGHMHITFGVEPRHSTFLPRFIVSSVAAFLTSSAITHVVHVKLDLAFSATMGLVALVVPIVSYLVLKFWVFAEETEQRSPPASDLALPTTGWMALMAFTAVSLCTVLPVAMHTYLPLVDLANHIARLHIFENIDGPLGAYFASDPRIVANAAVDFLWKPLAGHVHPVDFARATIIVYCLTFVGATMYLSWVVHGRWSVWPAAVGLVCYNANFFWGFQNYIFTLGFAIAAFGVYLQTERWALIWRFALLVPIATALYYMHFFPFAGLAIAAFGREVQRAFETQGARWLALFKGAIALIPFAVPGSIFVYGVLFGGPSVLGSKTEFGDLTERIKVLTSLSGGTGPAFPNHIEFLGYCIIGLLLYFAWCARSKSGPRLVLDPKLKGAVIALGIVVLITPTWLSGVAVLHIRFPIYLAALLFAGTRWTGVSPQRAMVLAGVIFALILARGVTFDRYAAQHDAEVRDMIALTEAVPAGARLLPVVHHPLLSDRRHWHMTAYAVTYHDVFIPTIFQGTHGIKVLPRWKSHSAPSLFPPSARWMDLVGETFAHNLRFVDYWPLKYNYLVMLDTDTGALDGLPELRRIGARGRFTLYEITASESAWHDHAWASPPR